MGINEVRMRRFLTGRNGPVTREVQRRAEGVRSRAYDNVSGIFLNVKTGRLRDGYQGNKGLHVVTEVVNGEVQCVIGTDAVDPKSGVSYPGVYNAGLRPWLSQALANEFTFGR